VGSKEPVAHKPLEFLYDRFTKYIEDRRARPRADVMTGLATATFPDGSTPAVHDVALIAGNLFAAGQETTARLLSFALQVAEALCDYHDLGITTFLIRGFDPLDDAIEYGRSLLPLTRKLIAERSRLAAE